jgi:hypothetical protein
MYLFINLLTGSLVAFVFTSIIIIIIIIIISH